MAVNDFTIDPVRQFESLMETGQNDAAMSVVSANPDKFANYNFEGIGAGNLGTLPKDEGFLGTGLSGLDATKAGLGIGQLGLGIAGYIDNKKTAGKQRELMGQQIASNRFLLNQAQGRQKDIGKAFGGGGLAASTRTV